MSIVRSPSMGFSPEDANPFSTVPCIPISIFPLYLSCFMIILQSSTMSMACSCICGQKNRRIRRAMSSALYWFEGLYPVANQAILLPTFFYTPTAPTHSLQSSVHDPSNIHVGLF